MNIEQLQTALDSFSLRIEAALESTLRGQDRRAALATWRQTYLEQTSAIVQDFERQHRIVSPPVACGRCCSYCCHVHVAASPPEVLLIAEFVKNLPNFPTMREHIRTIAGRIRGKTEVQRRDEKIPCALLTPDGACSIYLLRPFVCRGMTSLSVECCIGAYRDGRGQIPRLEHVYQLSQTLVKATLRAVRELGLDSTLMELTIGVDFVLSNPDCFDRWLRGEMVFAPAPRTDGKKPALPMIR